jgi:hypothetical protein
LDSTRVIQNLQLEALFLPIFSPSKTIIINPFLLQQVKCK